MTRRPAVGLVLGLLLCSVTTLGAGPALAAEPTGTLSFTPATGLDSYALTAVSTGTCVDPRGSNLQLRVSGHGFADDTNVTPNLPASVYPIDPALHGYDVPLQDTLRSFAAQQHPPAVLSGRYVFTLICKKPIGSGVFGTYTGSLSFTSPTHYTASQAAATGPTTTPTPHVSAGPTAGASPLSPSATAPGHPNSSASRSSTPAGVSSPGASTSAAGAGITPTQTAHPGVTSPGTPAAVPITTTPSARTAGPAESTSRAAIAAPTSATGSAPPLPVRVISAPTAARHHRVSDASVALLAAASVTAALLLGLFLRRRLSSTEDPR
jgi:hypothetical protein